MFKRIIGKLVATPKNAHPISSACCCRLDSNVGKRAEIVSKLLNCPWVGLESDHFFCHHCHLSSVATNIGTKINACFPG